MAITLITPHTRPNSGGVYAIEQLARFAAAETEVNVVVVKGDATWEIDGVRLFGPEALRDGTLPAADALVIPADMRGGERLLELPAEHGVPILMLQGFGVHQDPVVHRNLTLADRAICTSSWLADEARARGCTAALVRYGLDRAIFSPGSPTSDRAPVAAMMTHPLDWKGTADGLEALRIARAEIPELTLRLFGKLDPGIADAVFLAAPNQLRDVAAVMRESAVFVCSSWEEGFGLPGIEAIACGAALATTDTKGSRDYAWHRQTALVSPPRDPAALAKSIVTLVRSPELRRRLIDGGRDAVDMLHPDWPRATAAFLDAVDDFVRTAAVRRPGRTHGAADGPGDAGGDIETLRAALERRSRELRSARAESAELSDELARRADEALRARRSVRELDHELELLRAERQRLQAALRQSRRAEDAYALALTDADQAKRELAAARREVRRLRAELAAARDETRLAEAGRDTFLARAEELLALAAAPSEIPAPSPWPPLAPPEIPASSPWPQLPADELAVQDSFRRSHETIASMVHAPGDHRDPLAVPLPADGHRALAHGDSDQGAGIPTVDVVVCVHNAFEHVRECLWSVLAKTDRRFRLIVVNDGSDAPTTAFLAELAAALPALTLIHRVDPPHGYTIAANLGLRASTSDYLVLLNSDTVVTYGWLDRIVEHGERHPEVGILGPLSNAATHQSVPERRHDGQWATNPLPDWLTPDGMALVLDRAAPRTDTRLPFINGFCFVVKRAVVDAVGEFDEERFAGGYAEESDYAQRARAAGFELGVVDDAYVHHAKSQSYGAAAKPTARRAYEVFLDKHGAEEIKRWVDQTESATGLEPVRAAVARATADPEATASALAGAGDPELSVVFVLPGMSAGGSGGSHSIYQEVHGLRRLGVRARIALQERAFTRAGDVYDDAAEVFMPYADAADLAETTADANVIVATHFKSVATVAQLRARREDFLAAYYIQDYEPMFTFADEADNREAAASYTAVPGMLLFAKTHWICNVLERRHGVSVAKVEASIDDEVYRPGDGPARDGGPVRIAAMVRPRTPRRQPHSTVSVLERLLEEHPGRVEVTTFGCVDAELAALTGSTAIRSGHRGLLRRREVAALLGSSDVFLDMSTYQAFGRTALEAMACGATAVVPRHGGVWDFARDGENLITVDTLDRQAVLDAVVALAGDRDRLAAMKAAARATAARYSVMRAALSEYVVMRHAYRVRQRA